MVGLDDLENLYQLNDSVVPCTIFTLSDERTSGTIFPQAAGKDEALRVLLMPADVTELF